MPETNQSVDRATQILKILAAGGGRMTLTEIAEQVGVGNSTAHRILSSLCRGGLAQLDAKTRRYALGYGLLEMTADWLNRIEVRTAAMPSLQVLRQRTEETVALNLRDADRWVPVERLDTDREIRYVVELGKSRPLHVGAGGKAILAFLPKAVVDRQLLAGGLSPAKAKRLERELDDIRRFGTATTKGEMIPGACSISAPVFNRDGVIASLSLLCLASTLKAKTERTFARLVREAAAAVSRELMQSE